MMEHSGPDHSVEVLGIASGMKRAGGLLVDAFVFAAFQMSGAYLGGLVAATILGYRRAPASVIDESVVTGALFGWGFWGIVVFMLNYGILQGFTGSSIGKLAFGIKVVRRDGAALGITGSILRTLLYAVSALPGGWGFLTAFSSRTVSTWHDSILGTVVVLRGPSRDAIRLPAPIPIDRKAA
jgi:uncharacterized RDD family membrane protein YckC